MGTAAGGVAGGSIFAEKRGISRHVVRLVRATQAPDSEIYAVKETVAEFANREYQLLRQLSFERAQR